MASNSGGKLFHLMVQHAVEVKPVPVKAGQGPDEDPSGMEARPEHRVVMGVMYIGR